MEQMRLGDRSKEVFEELQDKRRGLLGGESQVKL
jgi:hypothetical protein